jgi:sporulation protein YlmC with PRC-barrel domain
MQIEYGTEVIDRNGKVLGTVNHLVHNTWTGEISKFVVRRKAPDRDLFLSTEDVLEVTNTRIRVGVSCDELSEDA